MTETTKPHESPREEAFDQVCRMEDPLRIIRNFAGALDRIARTLSDDNAALIVQEIALAIQARVEELDSIHEYFRRLHHPDRERFERDGWPSSEPE